MIDCEIENKLVGWIPSLTPYPNNSENVCGSITILGSIFCVGDSLTQGAIVEPYSGHIRYFGTAEREFDKKVRTCVKLSFPNGTHSLRPGRSASSAPKKGHSSNSPLSLFLSQFIERQSQP